MPYKEVFFQVLSELLPIKSYFGQECPNILTCGPQLRGHFKKNPEQIVILQKYQGFDFIKIYSFVTGEWMAYANHSGFYQLERYFNLEPKDRDQKFDDMIAPVVNKLKGKDIPICTTLVMDDIIVQKLFEPDRFMKKDDFGTIIPGK
jgi:hypothetical protein